MHVLYNILAQTGLPGITPTNQGVDLGNLAVQVLFALFWALVGAFIFTLVVSIAMRVFSLLTPSLDEIEEIRNGNVAIAMVMFAFLLSVAAVVAGILLKTGG
jgi:uncharacterized membrane protein YjfL (UPF0719 family)